VHAVSGRVSMHSSEGEGASSSALPLVIDLDGTLVRTDMLHESALGLLRDRPLRVLGIPFWLSKGKASLKRRLASHGTFDPKCLPYHGELVEWLKRQKASGRTLVLCTASDRAIASAVADHLEIFDDVIASDGTTNLAGAHKAELLEKRYGRLGFDYAGNSKADLPVWERARRGIVVNASSAVERKARDCCEIEATFSRMPFELNAWRRVLRLHQWLKNLLLFVPLLAAHQLTSGAEWGALLLAFLSFSLCASAVYVANDLVDLESDRLHPRKRQRAFASGQIPVWLGVLVTPLLLTVSFWLGTRVGGNFLSWLLFYFALTSAYSLGLKRLVLVDCLALAMLYTLRIIAGAAAVGHIISFWLLAFSVFLFLSLAFVKRYAELEIQLMHGQEKAPGRGYRTTDLSLVQTMGVAAGYAAVLVLALYLNSDAVARLYRAPEFVWGTVPVMLFWISWMWMQAHRGQMHDDPLEFAVKDRVSWLAGVVFALVILLGARGWP
jgi:4-hydroxybenzoate polyprenyltransferase